METGDSWSEYLKELGPDGPSLMTDFDNFGANSSFFSELANAPTEFPIPLMNLDGNEKHGEQPITISPATLLNDRHTEKTASTFSTRQRNNPTTEGVGVVQFMPKGESLTVVSNTSPSVSQDSPLTGTLNHSSNTDHPRRDAHMASEQRRRAIMRDSFERLQQLLPPSEYRKPSKANLLQAAVSYITYLKQTESTLRAKVQWLCKEKAILNHQIHGTTASFPVQATNKLVSEGGAMPPIAPAVPQRNHL